MGKALCLSILKGNSLKSAQKWEKSWGYGVNFVGGDLKMVIGL